MEHRTDIVGINTVHFEFRLWTRSINTRKLVLTTVVQVIPQCSFLLYNCSVNGLPDILYFTMSHPYLYFNLNVVKFLEYLNFIRFINPSVTTTRLSPRASSQLSSNHVS